MSIDKPNSIQNSLLTAIPSQELERLLPYLEPVTLEYKQILYLPEQPIDSIYFVNRGMVSLINVMEDGATVEAATVGSEGMVGVSLLLGVDHNPTQAITQIAGDALQMRGDVFKQEVHPNSPLHALLLRYTQALINQLAQTVACNQLHSVEQRCCRWLLLCQDRAGSDQFLLTQELLSQMLGVRRASVSEVAANLQEKELIRYRRGNVRILDRMGLEATACECYRAVTTEFERLLQMS